MKRKCLKALIALAVVCSFAACSDNTSNDEQSAKVMDLSGRYELGDNNEAIIDDVNFLSDIAQTDTNSLVFYQIFVGSFSDSNGDGIGDLRGIINRFDYINDGVYASGQSLGAEGIWLSPVMSSPSYHKYDVADYYKIDETFGTMDDLKELVNLCHERNVKLIIDLPINHTSTENQWFVDFCSAHRHGETESEYYDFYCYSDSYNVGSRTFKKISACDDFYEANFSDNMPELNYDNPAVKAAAVDVAKYYLEEIGIDGFRFDAAKYIYYGEENKNVDFWVWYMNQLKAIKPDLYTVAEVWDSDSLTQKYAVALNCFDFTMAQSDGMIATTAKKGDVNKFCSYVEQYIETVKNKNKDATILPFIANHDTDRAAGFMQVSNNFAYVAANLYLLGPGSPFIYYGEEIGMKGSRGSANTDANRRLAMLWGDGDTVKNPVGTTFSDDKQLNGTVADQIGNGDSMFNYYKRLIMIRKANPEIALGDYKALALADTKMGGFVSTYGDSYVAVFHNTSENPQTYDLSKATDLPLSTLVNFIGVGEAHLEGTMLTLDGQTSCVIRK